MLNIQIVEKSIGKKKILKDIDLVIEKPGLYGVVGKNGVGKTTFFNCLLGSVGYEGEVRFKGSKLSLQDILWCPTEPFLYDELSGKEFLDFYCLLTKSKLVNKDDFFFEIPENEFISAYSTGMKKKLYLNALLTKEYDLYIFDEPFNGLDIESNLELYSFFKELAKEKIVILSSHILESLYTHCDCIYLLKDSNMIKFEAANYKDIEQCFLDKII